MNLSKMREIVELLFFLLIHPFLFPKDEAFRRERDDRRLRENLQVRRPDSLYKIYIHQTITDLLSNLIRRPDSSKPRRFLSSADISRSSESPRSGTSLFCYLSISDTLMPVVFT